MQPEENVITRPRAIFCSCVISAVAAVVSVLLDLETVQETANTAVIAEARDSAATVHRVQRMKLLQGGGRTAELPRDENEVATLLCRGQGMPGQLRRPR